MLRLFNTVTLVVMFMVSSAQAQRVVELVPLAERPIGFDRNNIEIEASLFARQGYDNGLRFRSLQFHTEQTFLFLERIEVYYFQGDFFDNINVSREVRPGRPIDVRLAEPRSYIRSIRIFYQTGPRFTGQARLRIYGVPTRSNEDNTIPIPGPNPWVQLKCFEVDVFRTSSESSERLGSYRAIRLSLTGRYRVRVFSFRIDYVGGPSDILINERSGRLFNVGENFEVPLNPSGQNIDDIHLNADVDQSEGDVVSQVCVFGQRRLR